MRIILTTIIITIGLLSCSKSEILPGKYPQVQVILRSENPNNLGLVGEITVKGEVISINVDSVSAVSSTHLFNRDDKVSVNARLKNPTGNPSEDGIIFLLYTSLPTPDTLFYIHDTVEVIHTFTVQ